MTELKPCPFCGGKPEANGRAREGGDGFICFVSCCCGGYSARAHQFATGETMEAAQKGAADAWNRRAEPQK